MRMAMKRFGKTREERVCIAVAALVALGAVITLTMNALSSSAPKIAHTEHLTTPPPQSSASNNV